MGKHYNSKHDDNAWRAWFGRWHAGETALALIREARVSMDTWNANARRLGMQIRDLPPDHPKRRAPAFGERPAEYRHRNSLLTEGQWAALFAKRAAGAPDRVLSLEYGVHPATICTQAKKRGLRREDLGMGAKGPSASPARRASHLPQKGEENGAAPSTTRAETPGRSPSPSLRDGEVRAGAGALSPPHPVALKGDDPPRGGEGEAALRGLAPLHPASPRATQGPPPPQGEELSEIELAGLGVRIRRGDWAGTADSFDSGVEAAGLRGDLHGVVALCEAKLRVWKAMFGAGSPGSSSPPHPLALTGEDPPRSGEGEPTAPVTAPIELRAAQRAPEGDWATWLFLGGRGAGKTLAGAMWLADMADWVGPGGRLALIGPTLHDVREVMIEGVSGLRSLPRWAGGPKPVFEITRRRLVFPNGAVAQVFSAEDPDSLRGPQFSAAWADEFCAWRSASETLALLRMGLRLALPTGKGATARLAEPRCLSADAVPEGSEHGTGAQAARDRVASVSPPLLCITTTPRPTAALRALRAEASCVESHAGTADNADHLSPGFLAGLEALYGGTRRAAQEIEGKVVELDGALFTAEMLARARRESPSPSRGGSSRSEGVGAAPQDSAQGTKALPTRPLRGHPPRDGEGDAPIYDRVIVAIDPTTTAGGNACGIIVAGRIGRTGAGFEAALSDGSVVRASSLVLATGGKSIPKMGATGWAYETARGFGLRITETRPALVPLTFEPGLLEKLAPLAGLSVEAVVSHRPDPASSSPKGGRPNGETAFEEGLLFTHRGLSGPSILQISSYWREGEAITVRMAPGEDVYARLKAAKEENGKQMVHTALGHIVPRRLAESVCEREGVKGKLAEVGDKVLRRLDEAVNGWTVKPVGSEGYRTAEVTLGGIATDELDQQTMEAKAVPGLFVIGEAADVTGWLGGYNFQWAWSSGWAAGQHC